jgi:hypothetical protein
MQQRRAGHGPWLVDAFSGSLRVMTASEIKRRRANSWPSGSSTRPVRF